MTARRGTAVEHAVDSPAAPSSARAFGYVMAVVLLLFAGAAFAHANPWAKWLTLAAIVLALLGQFAPFVLAPLNRLWMGLGHLLGRIVSPIMMSLIYFGVVTPIAFVARWRGVDPMKRRFDPQASTYWIERNPPGPDPATMERQW